MTIFRLKQIASTTMHAATGAIRWNYDRVELIADGVVHAVGIVFGLIAATVLVVLTAVYASALDVVAVSIYVGGLLSMLVFSASYNLWPVSRTKWVLRRFDHSAIYLLIAATYTPFIMELKDSVFRPLRPARGRALSGARLERHHAVRFGGRGAAAHGALARGRRRRAL